MIFILYLLLNANANQTDFLSRIVYPVHETQFIHKVLFRIIHNVPCSAA